MENQIKPALSWLFLAIYVLLSLFVMGRYLLTSNMGDTWRAASLEQMVEGSAERPYVYRRLVPAMTLAVMSVTPLEVQKQVGEAAGSFLTQIKLMRSLASQKRALRLALEKTDAYYIRGVAAVIVYGFLWLFIVSAYKLGAHFYPDAPAMRLLMPVVGLLLVPPLMVPTAYVYDIAGLGLASACYYCFAAARWRWFFVWFALACWNKETAIFLTAFFALWFFGRMERREFMGLLALQLLVFAAIRCAIWWQFKDNPGIFLATSYIVHQAALLAEGYSYKTLAVLFVFGFALFYRWGNKPHFARYGIWMLLMMYAAYFLFGRPGEFRVFLDVLPPLVLLVTHTLASCANLISGECNMTAQDKYAPGDT